MNWQEETAAMAADVRDGFKRSVPVIVTAREPLSETYDPGTGKRTTNASVQAELAAWCGPVRTVDDRAQERDWFITAADLDIDTLGDPSEGWEITDTTEATRSAALNWQVSAQPELEADGAVWRLPCRRGV